MSPKHQAIRNLSTLLHLPRCPRCTKRRKGQSRKTSKLTDLQIFSLQPRDNNRELPVQWSLKAKETATVSASACGSLIAPRERKWWTKISFNRQTIQAAKSPDR